MCKCTQTHVFAVMPWQHESILEFYIYSDGKWNLSFKLVFLRLQYIGEKSGGDLIETWTFSYQLYYYLSVFFMLNHKFYLISCFHFTRCNAFNWIKILHFLKHVRFIYYTYILFALKVSLVYYFKTIIIEKESVSTWVNLLWQ